MPARFSSHSVALRLVSGPEGQCHARSGQVRVRLAFTIVSHLKGRAHWQAVGHRFIRQQLADSSLSTPAFCILASHTGIQVRRRSAPSLPFSVPGATVRAAAGHCKIKVSNHPPRSGPDYPRAHMWGPPGSQGLRRLGTLRPALDSEAACVGALHVRSFMAIASASWHIPAGISLRARKAARSQRLKHKDAAFS